jgi:hypothetical protein
VTPKPFLALVTAALTIAVAATGCSHAHVVGHHRTLVLALTEYRIDPQTVHMTPGPLTIIVRNYGHRTHNLVVTMDGQAVGSTKPLWPGTSSRLKVSLPAGHYVMTSTILSDQALGEYGTLVVR